MPHIHEKIDFTAEVFIVFKNRVLLRKHDKLKIWLSVGGHIELDEDPEQAALREVREEVGLAVEIIGDRLLVNEEGKNGYHELLPPRFMNRHRISATHEHITFVYFARASTEIVNNQSEERSDELRWFTISDLEDPSFGIRDSVIKYAKAALAVVQ